ncbi:hypothetical protein GCM10010524_18790 [Streptomyces mexicanus]
MRAGFCGAHPIVRPIAATRQVGLTGGPCGAPASLPERPGGGLSVPERPGGELQEVRTPSRKGSTTARQASGRS